MPNWEHMQASILAITQKARADYRETLASLSREL